MRAISFGLRDPMTDGMDARNTWLTVKNIAAAVMVT